MSYKEAMRDLKAAGTAQNHKVYARHGVTGPGAAGKNAAKRATKKARSKSAARAR